MRLFAGLDIGTSGVRCSIFDERGAPVATGERAWSYHSDDSGFPQLQMRPALDEACRDALDACDAGTVAADGVTSQRTGCVFVGADGEELYVGPNADGRALAEGIAQERAHGPRIYAIAGRLPAMLYMPARLAWWRANRADRAVAAVRSLGDHIVATLCGAHATEPTQAAELLVFDVGNGAYSNELCVALDVPRHVLPPVGVPGAPAGEVQAGVLGFAPGTLVIPAGADTQCAALAVGATQPGDAVVVAGTTMIVQQVRADPRGDPDGRLWISPHAVAGAYVQEAHCGEAGALIAWLSGLFGVTPGELAALADAADPGAGGMVVVDTQPGVVTDFTLVRQAALTFPAPVLALGRSRTDVARAAFEGVAFGAREGLGWLRLAAGEPQRVFATGGVARSDAFMQALAGSVERAVVRATDASSSARGAAIAAAATHHGGVHAAVQAMRDHGAEVAPDAVAGYPRHHAAWRERVAAMEPMSMRLSRL